MLTRPVLIARGRQFVVRTQQMDRLTWALQSIRNAACKRCRSGLCVRFDASLGPGECGKQAPRSCAEEKPRALNRATLSTTTPSPHICPAFARLPHLLILNPSILLVHIYAYHSTPRHLCLLWSIATTLDCCVWRRRAALRHTSPYVPTLADRLERRQYPPKHASGCSE